MSNLYCLARSDYHQLSEKNGTNIIKYHYHQPPTITINYHQKHVLVQQSDFVCILVSSQIEVPHWHAVSAVTAQRWRCGVSFAAEMVSDSELMGLLKMLNFDIYLVIFTIFNPPSPFRWKRGYKQAWIFFWNIKEASSWCLVWSRSCISRTPSLTLYRIRTFNYWKLSEKRHHMSSLNQKKAFGPANFCLLSSWNGCNQA